MRGGADFRSIVGVCVDARIGTGGGPSVRCGPAEGSFRFTKLSPHDLYQNVCLAETWGAWARWFGRRFISAGREMTSARASENGESGR